MYFLLQALRKDGWLHFLILSHRPLTFVSKGNVAISSDRLRCTCVLVESFELYNCFDLIFILHSYLILQH